MNLKAMKKRPLKDYVIYSLIGYAFASAISITLAEFFFIAGLAFWIADVIKNKIPIKEQFKSPISIPLAVFLLLHLLSAFFGIDMLNSVKDYRKVFIMFMFFLAANYAGKEQDLKNIVKAFVSGAVIVGLYAIINTVYHRYGLHELNFRASSFSGNHMHAGGMLMMACIVSSAALVHEIKNNFKNRTGIVLYALAFVIISGGLLFTYTRGSWFAAFVGVLMIAGYTDRRLLIATLVVFVLTVFILKDTSFVKRAGSAVQIGQKTSASERILMWKSGLQMIKDRPLIGVGTANVHNIYPKYRLPGTFEKNQGHLHNNLVQLAVIDGIPGMLAYLWIFVAMWVFFLRGMAGGFKEYQRIIFFSCFCVSIGFFINGFFEYNFFSSQPALMFWFLTGLGYSVMKSETPRPESKT